MIRMMRSQPILLALAMLSSGCDSDEGGSTPRVDCTGRSGLAGQFSRTIVSGGLTRSYRLTVPESYDGTAAFPLILNIHGLSSNAAQQEMMAGLPDRAEEGRFITVAPEGTGTPRSWNGAGCCPPASGSDVDDVGFIRDLVSGLSEEYCIDPARVHATGMSNGGFMSNRLACEAADQVASVAPVVSVLGGMAGFEAQDCQPSRPVPILMFNGTLDPLISYDGGALFPSVGESFERWAALNGCRGQPEVSFDRDDVACLTHNACDEGATTTLCTVEGGGHTWPGNTSMAPILEQVGMGRTTQTLDATDTMLEFFADHPLP